MLNAPIQPSELQFETLAAPLAAIVVSELLNASTLETRAIVIMKKLAQKYDAPFDDEFGEIDLDHEWATDTQEDEYFAELLVLEHAQTPNYCKTMFNPSSVSAMNVIYAENDLLNAIAPLFGTTLERINRKLGSRKEWLETILSRFI